MAIVYLAPGQQFTHNSGNTRVGASGTCVDTGIDWNSVSAFSTGVDDEDPGRVGEVVGDGSRSIGGKREERMTFDVFIDTESGKYWYDDEYGY